MKKLKNLFLVMLGVLMLAPVFVSAEGDSSTKEKINIYFFRGEGCEYCAAAEEFFTKIESEYGKYYNLVDYETWYNEENAELLEEVSSKLKKEVNGVPYIVIGKEAFDGFNEDMMGEDIKKAIKAEYESKDRYDVMKALDEKDNNGIIVVIVSIILIGGFTTLIIFARKK